jgi:AraC-like DNA-binding protein
MRDTALARSRHELSPIRHGESALRVFGLDLGATQLVPPQPPGWAHLVTVRAGALAARSAGRQTLVIPGRALWVPAGIPYALALRTRCKLRILYVATAIAPARSAGALTVTPLLDELLERAMRRGYLDPAEPRDRRLAAVVHDELLALPAASGDHELVLPRDPALARAVEWALAARETRPSIAALARAAALSIRTFERRFKIETGLSPRAWLRRARLLEAMAALAGGASVTETGLACGYASLSAFIAAYRAAFGTTPGRASVSG